VSLGDSNATEVVVKEGVHPGEQVALNPFDLLPEEKRQKTVPTPPASRKNTGADRAKGKGKSVRATALLPTIREKLRWLDPGERAKMKNASQEEREAILKKAGFIDDELRQLSEIRRQNPGPN
jgi:hypothetical protein